MNDNNNNNDDGYPDDFDHESGGYDDCLEDDYHGGDYDDDGCAEAGIQGERGEGFEDDVGGQDFEREDYGCDEEGIDQGQVSDGDDRAGRFQVRDECRCEEADPRCLDDRCEEEEVDETQKGYEDYIRGQVDDYVKGQLDDGCDDQGQKQEETHDERHGHVSQGIDEGDDGNAEQHVPQEDRHEDSGCGGEHQDDDTMGVYNNSDDAFQCSPSGDQDDEAVGEGIKSYAVGCDEEYEAMEELHRQRPAEYGGGDTINDDNEDYSNALCGPPRVRAQMRRDREASRRRSRQQRGRRGPDAEERGHEQSSRQEPWIVAKQATTTTNRLIAAT